MKNQSLMDSLDLSAIAHQAMIDAGFVPDVPPSVLADLRSLESQRQTAVADSSARDLRSLLWSSIDDRKSRDLDQVEYELGEQLPAQPDSRALPDFLARRKTADPQHFPDLSLSIIKLLGPGEYTVQTPGTSGEQSVHFGLAVHDYTHSTAPNRRYADLVSQRLVKAVLGKGAGPYTEAELTAIAAHCTERE